ncbi:PREDICTED: uncharacterized protein LOC108360161 [Rhagoletis zephyria]|uniref:uncharacterized protein LOC108360161 n=1 Tax=Rhagoletis zephyria TaxID=28612 RepID=UPI0008118A9B|nr:PREDICTED: uncharacterized protein LOC108360161 [Rhagoletis zephyria]XP_036335179.1 uncharacterized protein LOC118745693 [Rhagoletis pomonella]
MKAFLVIVLAWIVCVAAQDDKKASESSSDSEIKIYKRLIPADVLRDFPGMCFASTRCATVEPGKTWELTPFCGRSTCVQNDEKPAKLLELVEDCGPLPLANEKCKLDTEKTNKTAPFPYCCPIFTCEPGVKLEYPEIPNEEPKKE